MIGGALPCKGYSWSESKDPARLTMAAPPSREGTLCTFNDQHRGLISQQQGQENNFAMVQTREAVFSKVLRLSGIKILGFVGITWVK